MSAAVAERPKARAKASAALEGVDDFDRLFGKQWRSLEWRLDNLYWIVDKSGKKVRFVMEDEQRDLIRNLHTRNLVLKARQLGFSTLIEILQFDQAMFNADHTGVVIADTLPNAAKLFAKIEFAQKHLDAALIEAFPIKTRTSRVGLTWDHGSEIYVSTSSRGGTPQLLHVSEFGKICRKWPERAQEIVSGAFESVPIDGTIIVESTAEGAAGEFYDMTMAALKRLQEGSAETSLDWRLHFYPWWKKAEYRLPMEEAVTVVITDTQRAYFDKMQAECGTVFDIRQRAWYVKKQETQGRLMKREYPATPQEAFEQAVEGAVFGEEMTRVREQGRVTVVPLDREYPVYTFWDFGTNDATAIWLMQRIGLQHRWVRYLSGTGTGLGAWWRRLEDYRAEHGFRWGGHFLPHDADTEMQGESLTTKSAVLEKLGMREITVVGRIPEKQLAIDLMRAALPADNWFDRTGCADGIKCLDGYQFEWNDKMGQWSNAPLHNWASHGVDAWMQYAQSGFKPKTEKASRTLRNFKNRVRRGI